MIKDSFFTRNRDFIKWSTRQRYKKGSLTSSHHSLSYIQYKKSFLEFKNRGILFVQKRRKSEEEIFIDVSDSDAKDETSNHFHFSKLRPLMAASTPEHSDFHFDKRGGLTLPILFFRIISYCKVKLVQHFKGPFRALKNSVCEKMQLYRRYLTHGSLVTYDSVRLGPIRTSFYLEILS